MSRCSRRARTVLAAVLSFSIAASALAADSCSLRTPDPVLRPGAYPGQLLSRQGSHSTLEVARIRPGLRIEIRLDGCEDFVTASFTLIAARAQGPERTEDEWIDFARTEIGRLKMRGPPGRFADLDAFLGQARGIVPREGSRTLCRDGSAPAAGDCSWDSLGGYTISVRHTRDTTTVTVIEYISA